jgi:nucleolar GTP-binding protein
MRSRFPRRPWIDVVSKADKEDEFVEGSLEELEDILEGAPYFKVSALDGTGIDELRTDVLRMLGEVRVVLDAIAAGEQNARP